MQKNRSHLLICGDFNYPSIDWEHEYVAERSNIIPFLQTIQACFLHQHVFQPTRFRDGNEPSLLDLIFTNEEGLLNDLAHNAALGNNDHECVNFTLDCYKEVQCTTKKPNYSKADYISIRDRLSRVNWVTELRRDLATSYINFFKILEDAMDGCVPEYNKKRKKKNMYITTETTRKKDLKNKLWRGYKSTKCEYDRRRYITVKNELRSPTRNLRI